MYEPQEDRHAFVVVLKYTGISENDAGYLANMIVPEPTIERHGDDYVFSSRVDAADFLPALNMVLKFVAGIPMKRLRVANGLVEVSARVAEDD